MALRVHVMSEMVELHLSLPKGTETIIAVIGTARQILGNA